MLQLGAIVLRSTAQIHGLVLRNVLKGTKQISLKLGNSANEQLLAEGFQL